MFTKYDLKESAIDKAIIEHKVMKFREGALEYINYLHNNNIPLIIVFGGLRNFIEKFLKVNKCYYDNIYIISNYINFKNGVAYDIGDTIIHTFNKNKVGFLRKEEDLDVFKDNFDIIVTDDTDYYDIINYLFKE